VVAAAAGVLGLWPASGSATVVTVGTPSAAFGSSMSLSSCSSCTQFQVAAPGYTLAVPAAGHITAWRAVGRGPLALRVLRPAAGGGLTAVASSAAAAFAGSATFPADIPVAPGDQIGVDLLPTSGPVGQLHFSFLAGATFAQAQPAVAAGGPVSAAAAATGALSLDADVTLAPVASAVDVGSGPVGGGTAVAIAGSYLDGASTVTFGGVPVAFTLDPTGRLLVRTPPWPAPGQVDVKVAGPGGSSTLFGAFTYLPGGASPPGGGGASPAPAPGRPAPAAAVPVLGSLSMSPAAFLAAPAGASLAAAATGTRLSYSDSVAATTRFAVDQQVAGRLVRRRGGVGHYCQPVRRAVPAVARCRRYVALAPGFSHHDRAGPNLLRFTGRLGGRALAPGAYRLSAVATDARGARSRPVVRAFRILAAPPRRCPAGRPRC
jgi:hypothetical protein